LPATDEQKTAVTPKRFHRRPGLYDQFDLGFMLDEPIDFYIEKAGETDEGDPLFAIYEGEFFCKDCRDKVQGHSGAGETSEAPTA
jgi:hypothetical protein